MADVQAAAITGMRLVVGAAEDYVRDHPQASGADLLKHLRETVGMAVEALEQRGRGPCKHCGIEVLDVEGRLVHAGPGGHAGDVGCRANLFRWDQDRWAADPPELRRKKATVA